MFSFERRGIYPAQNIRWPRLPCGRGGEFEHEAWRQTCERLERQRRACVVRLIDDHHRAATGDDFSQGVCAAFAERAAEGVAGGVDLPALRISDAELLDGRHQDHAGGVVGARW